MSVKTNKKLIQTVHEEFNKGNVDAAAACFAEQVVIHGVTTPAPGREGYRLEGINFIKAFPGGQTTIDDLIAEGDRVVTRWTYRGMHKGEFAGAAPTNKEIVIWGIYIDRIDNGKIAERWVGFDPTDFLKQLGLM